MNILNTPTSKYETRSVYKYIINFYKFNSIYGIMESFERFTRYKKYNYK